MDAVGVNPPAAVVAGSPGCRCGLIRLPPPVAPGCRRGLLLVVLVAAVRDFLLPLLLDAASIERAARRTGSRNSGVAATRVWGCRIAARRGGGKSGGAAGSQEGQREVRSGSGKSGAAAGSQEWQQELREGQREVRSGSGKSGAAATRVGDWPEGAAGGQEGQQQGSGPPDCGQERQQELTRGSGNSRGAAELTRGSRTHERQREVVSGPVGPMPGVVGSVTRASRWCCLGGALGIRDDVHCCDATDRRGARGRGGVDATGLTPADTPDL